MLILGAWRTGGWMLWGNSYRAVVVAVAHPSCKSDKHLEDMRCGPAPQFRILIWAQSLS